jgi:hypothetical protein
MMTSRFEERAMPSKKLQIIITDDTNEEYVFDGETLHDALYEITLTSRRIHPLKGEPIRGGYEQVEAKVYLEKQTLINAGSKEIPKPERTEEPKETMEDLLLRMLEHVGFNPEQVK